MIITTKNTFKESVIVTLGFIAWLALCAITENRGPLVISDFGGTCIFLVIAFLVDEGPKGAFVSRAQVIGVAACFLFLGLSRLSYFVENIFRQQIDSLLLLLVTIFLPIVISFLFYRVAILLIRGFYSAPVHQN